MEASNVLLPVAARDPYLPYRLPVIPTVSQLLGSSPVEFDTVGRSGVTAL